MNNGSASKKPRRLDVSFTAKIERIPKPGGWSYVVWPESVEFFGTRGRVKVKGRMDGVPFVTSFMALGDGRHMLPVKEEIRAQLEKGPGDTIKIQLQEQLG